MLKDITLGQYFPGSTIMHRLDPRTKLIMTLLYIVALFIAQSYISYALMAVLLVVGIMISKLKPGVIMKGLKPIIIVIIITAILNIFYTTGNVIAEFWIFKITDAGIRNAIFMALRIMMLITGTLLLTYTTSPIDLTDGLEKLLNPLKKIKVPVHELAMMMTIALRFIPTLIEETDKIMAAQKARGADFDTGNLIQRAKAMLPLLVPLFVSAFRRADDLAVAMESRCYHGGIGRTKMKQLKMKTRDIVTLAVGALVLAGTITLARFGL